MTTMSKNLLGNLIKYRWLSLVFAICLIFAAAGGLKKIEVNNDYRDFIGEANSALQVSDWLNDRQGDEKESVIVIYQPADGNLFSQASFMQYIYFVRLLKEVNAVDEVSSLLEQKKLVAHQPNDEQNLLFKEAAIAYGIDLFEVSGLQQLANETANMPTIAKRFVGEGASTGAAVLFLKLDENSSRRKQLQLFNEHILSIEKTLQESSPDDAVFVAGATLYDFSASQVLSDDLKKILPLALILILLTFWIIYRSIRFSIVALLIIITPVIATAGMSGWLSLPFSNLVVSGLLLVGTLAVADVMHMSNTYFREVARGSSTENAATKSLASNFKIIVATTLTTSIGQTALLFSVAEPIRIMGSVIILGSWFALVLATLMLPAVLMRISASKHFEADSFSKNLSAFSMLGYTYSTQVLIGAFTIITISLILISNSKLSDSLTAWFDEDTHYNQSMQILDEQYLGSDTITIAIEATAGDLLGAKRWPAQSENLDNFVSLASSLDQKNYKGTWLHPIKVAQHTKQTLNDNSDSSFWENKLDEFSELDNFSTESVAHSGLMTMFSPGKLDYSLWYFDSGYDSSFRLVEKVEDIEQFISKEIDDRQLKVGGVGLALAQLGVENFWSVLKGSLLTLSFIALTMFFVMYSFRLGLISLLPNFGPIIIAFGMWAAIEGYFNLATITVFGLALGIVVDDTIHILLKYKQCLKSESNREAAFRTSIRECSVGIFATTMVIGIGFVLLGTSGFLLTAQKAQLAALTVFVAFVFDLLVVPALVAKWDMLNFWRSGES